MLNFWAVFEAPFAPLLMCEAICESRKRAACGRTRRAAESIYGRGQAVVRENLLEAKGKGEERRDYGGWIRMRLSEWKHRFAII